MSGQKNLTAFFKPLPKKRSSTDAELDIGENTDKRSKSVDSDQLVDSNLNGAQLKHINEDEIERSFASGDVLLDSDGKQTVSNGPALLKDNSNIVSIPACKKEDKNLIPSPFGMITPLQYLAKVKSQCAKTPVLHSSIGSTWFFALHAEFQKPYFRKLSDFVINERQKSTVYPPADQVWTWTTKVPIKDIKVVILGQDPYHNPGQAHGLCFSVAKGVPSPPSLINMYKELSDDIPGFSPPNHGYLDGWAQQGVLLLNACLTVRMNSPNSHRDQGWEQLTDAVIKYLSDNGRGIVFLLWGSYAQKKGAVVDKKKHHLLKAVHPSPLSAHRGFFGCKHFSQCNDLLKKAGKKPIDWSYLP